MKLEGVLVDLVPYGSKFQEQEHRWKNNSDAVFFWDVGNRWFVSKASLERRQQEREAEQHHRDTSVIFGVQTKDGLPIGLFGTIWLIHAHRTAMLTALIGDPAYWSGGYGTDALLLFVDYAFDWLDTRKIWLMTMSANVRVMRQMEKVGFRLEVRHRRATWTNDCWADLLTYGLLRNEWPGRAAMVDKLGLHAAKARP